MARTDTLGNFLTDVADAIRTKKGTSEAIPAEDFDTEIENLPSGGDYNATVDTTGGYTGNVGIKALITEVGDIDTSSWTSMKSLFEGCSKLTTISLLDTSKVTTMQSMFGYCAELRTIPLLNTSKVTAMQSMFSNCTNLITIPLLDTSKVTTINNMFYTCPNLTAIPKLDVSAATNMTNMFVSCSSLTNVVFNNTSTSTPTRVNGMFVNCTQLTHIDFRDFNFSNITNSSYYNDMFGASASNGVPDNCEIIVADDTQKTWITSKFTRLTNVKTVAEYEIEQGE